MEKQEQGSTEGLPPIPDYPDAPLPAWKHYGVTNYADQKILEELKHVEYPGFMVGLKIAYTIETEQIYCMQFGDTTIPQDALEKSRSEEINQADSSELDEELPFTDEFLSSLFDDIGQLITNNTPGYSGEINPKLTIAITGSRKVIDIMDRYPPYDCNKGHTDRRTCKSVNDGPWKCTHRKAR